MTANKTLPARIHKNRKRKYNINKLATSLKDLTEEFLIPQGLTQTALAEKLGCAPRSVNEICNGKRAISPLMAMRLAEVFDNTPEFWMNLQTAWDLWKEWEKHAGKKRTA